VNPSGLFIGRPVATTLLTVAIAIAGAIAFAVLTGVSSAAGGFSTITVAASLPGASPGYYGVSIATTARTSVRAYRRGNRKTSASSLGTTGITTAIRFEPATLTAPHAMWKRALTRRVPIFPQICRRIQAIAR